MMKPLVSLSLLLLFLAVATATKEEKIFKPQQWDLVGPVSATHEHKVQLTIAITQQNKYKLEELFWAVSDPQSPKYGQYLSLDELTTLIAPSPQSLAQIESWLADHDVTGCSSATTKDFLHCEVRVEKAEEMLNTKFFEFVHNQNKDKKLIRALSYRIPSEVAPHVDYIGGVIGFPVEHKAKRLTLEEMQVQGVIPIGPKELRQRYQVPDNVVGTQSNNSQAVAEFQAQYYSPSDLSSFFRKFVSNSKDNSVYKVVGTNDPSNPGVEANLDIQYIMGVAPAVNTWFWSNPNFDFWSDLTNWLSQISSTPNPPLVHSISYGSQGNYPSESYRTRLDTEFQKLGARGLSIIFASGDSGTGCSFCNKFQPSFPATSVYVTSVGATQFINDKVGPERAVESFGSGGGFSLFFPRPAYQNASVTHYFQTETDLPEPHFYNKNGRGTPDVAALGIGFSVLVNGQVQSVGGTSASAPTFAGIVSLLNDIRLKNKKAPLGFLNPFIYQTFANHPDAFFDVTEGNNRHGCCGLTGFKAAPGWDPVTGVGTPNFGVLSKLV